MFGSTWWFNDKKVKDIMSEIDAKIEDVSIKILAESREMISSFSKEKASEIDQTIIILQKNITDAITELTSRFSQFTENTRTEVKEDIKANVANYQDLLKSYNENLSSQIAAIKESYEERINLLSAQILKNEKKYEEQLKNESNKTKRDILSHEADIAFLKGNMNIALKRYLDFALFEFEIGNNWSFKYSSKDIIKCLEKTSLIYSDELKALESLLAISKAEYPEQAEKIRLLYQDQEVKKL